MSSIDEIVDKFVHCINSSDLEPLEDEEVPKSLRTGERDEWGQFYWEVIPRDLQKNAQEIQTRLSQKLPQAYLSFISRYAFPGFELEQIFFFANTNESNLWELSKRIFTDKFMSPFLIKNGLVQIGNPSNRSYDPVCFDCRQGIKKEKDYPLVQIDHEGILLKEKILVTNKIAPSFLNFIDGFINKTH